MKKNQIKNMRNTLDTETHTFAHTGIPLKYKTGSHTIYSKDL